MSVDNSTQTNPNSTAQTIPDTSYAGATIPPAASQPPAAPPTPAPTAPTAPSVPPAAATQPTSQPQPTPQPKTKQEWMMHLIKMAPPQNVVTTNPDGTQTVENRATPVSLAHLVLTSALAG